VQELLTQDKVDAIIGFSYSPDAIASAPVISAGKKLAVIANAGTSFITNLSPDFVRTSFTMWHSGYSLGAEAAKTLHAKTAVVAYTDYPPGKDSLEAFKNAFEANGGKVIDAIPAGGPGAVPDFTPFFQRAKDEKPDVLYVFVPAGDHARAAVKTYGALGMGAAGIKLIGPGDIVQDSKLQGMGGAAVGLITMHHYNADLDNPQNKRFVAAWKKEYGADAVTDFFSVGAYDAMAATVHAVQATKGKMDGDAAVKSLLGWKFDSPVPQKSKGQFAPIGSVGWKLVDVHFGSEANILKRAANVRFAPESGLRETLWEFTLSPLPPRKLTAPPLAARNGAESGRAARAAADAWRSQQAVHLQHYICA
jgi:branched-chain amino acid transport system substrate-binding protein